MQYRVLLANYIYSATCRNSCEFFLQAIHFNEQQKPQPVCTQLYYCVTVFQMCFKYYTAIENNNMNKREVSAIIHINSV